MKVKLNNKLGLALNEVSSVEVNGFTYRFDVSTYMKNDQKIVAHVIVDCYIDGEWDDEFSDSFHIGDVIDTKTSPWLYPFVALLK